MRDESRGVWERGTFTVPADKTEEDVARVADRYISRFGDALEKQGFQVRAVTRPAPSKVQPEPDRRLYVMHALVYRRPKPMDIWVPDNAVPEFLALGLKLKE